MKRKNLFGKSVSVLVVAVLAVIAFIRGSAQIWFLGGVFALWGIYMITCLLKTRKRDIGAYFQRWELRRKYAAENRAADKVYPNLSSDLDTSSIPVNSVLLRHVNHRISAYLKSAYPDVTWEWVSKDPSQIVASGGTGRIRLYGIADFNYANVMFDQLAKINCDMMKIVPLAELGNPAASTNIIAAGQPIDPEVWYSIHGKSVLDSCVAELHSRGHARLSITENGEIHVSQAGTDIVHAKFPNLPAKVYWKGLTKVFEKSGLVASVIDDAIIVSW